MIKAWLRNWLFKDEVEEPQQLAMEKIALGETAEEKIGFWQDMKNWLDMPQGKAFLAIQQREYNRIHVQLLTEVDGDKVREIVAQMRQQNFVISTPVEIDRKIAKWQKRAAANEKRTVEYPQAA